MKIENDAARYYSPSLNKYVLEEKDRPDDCIVEKFTGFQNKYGTPVFDGDVVCRRQFFKKNILCCKAILERTNNYCRTCGSECRQAKQ